MIIIIFFSSCSQVYNVSLAKICSSIAKNIIQKERKILEISLNLTLDISFKKSGNPGYFSKRSHTQHFCLF